MSQSDRTAYRGTFAMTTVQQGPTTAYGACQTLVTEAWECGLIGHAHLHRIRHMLQATPAANPTDLADWLIREGIVTKFQANMLLVGRGRDLTFWVYTLLYPIGNGSLGTVYKARGKTNGRPFAIKMVPRRDAYLVTQAYRKLQAFTSFRHAAVVPLEHLGTISDHHYLVWPFIADGESLPDAVARRGPLPVAEVVRLAFQAADGLFACHERGLVHGLLKPSDVRLTHGRVKILNFGPGMLLAERRNEAVFDTDCSDSQINASLCCASPETVLDQKVRTAASDQYSLGSLLYLALTGSVPYPQPNVVRRLLAQQSQPFTPLREANPRVPGWLADLIHRMLAVAPADRFADLGEVCRVIADHTRGMDAAADGADQPERLCSENETVPEMELPALPEAPAPDQPRPSWARLVLNAAAALVGVIGVSGLTWWWLTR